TREDVAAAPVNPPPIPITQNPASTHASWSARPFRHDTATCLELSGCRLRYHCAMTRTVYLGQPPADMLRVAEATKEGYEAALATVKQGALCRDVAGSWTNTISK